jgi:hypothetical protein
MVERSFSYKICKSQSLRIVFEYFEQAEQIKMQAVNKRFYNTFCPAIVKKVHLYRLGNMSVGVVVWPKEDCVNLLMPGSLEWRKHKFELAAGTEW